MLGKERVRRAGEEPTERARGLRSGAPFPDDQRNDALIRGPHDATFGTECSHFACARPPITSRSPDPG